MLTDLGKMLRKMRVDCNERLVDMGKRLGQTASFISAVETGTKAPPQRFEEKVILEYALDPDAARALRAAADRSRKAFTLEPNSSAARETAALFARKLNTLDDAALQDIYQILTKVDD